MPYIILIIFPIFFFGCIKTPATPATQTTQNKSISTLLISTQLDTNLTETKVTETNITIAPLLSSVQNFTIQPSTIEGKYRLIQGTRSFEGMHQNIDNAQLVIEQLDDNDFGYYFITKIGQLPPNSSFGIFHQKGDKYVQKVIENDENSTQPKVSFIENIQLIYNEPKLKLIIQARGKKNILWERVVSEFQPNEEMNKALKEAKHDYIKFYKEKFSQVIDL